MVAPLNVSVIEEDPLEVVKFYCQVVKHIAKCQVLIDMVLIITIIMQL